MTVLMEGVKIFLESSSIHGLNYISTSRKLVKALWVIIVIAGFTGAGVMISKSVKDWSDNPVSTTIETRPINEIKYPKVTVCPPKNTYTSLNHDLQMLGNTTIDYDLANENSTAYQLLSSFEKHFLQSDFEAKLTETSRFKEQSRYRNWYDLINSVPMYMFDNRLVGDDGVKDIETHASVGNISSPNFKEKFDSNKFELTQHYSIRLIDPSAHSKKTYKMKYDIDGNFECIKLKTHDADCLDPNKNEIDFEEGQGHDLKIFFFRSFQELDFEDWHTKRFTGFSIQWEYYTPNKAGTQLHSHKRSNKNFIRMANFIHKTIISERTLWKIVMQVKVEWLTTIKNPIIKGYGTYLVKLEDMYDDIYKQIGEKLNGITLASPL